MSTPQAVWTEEVISEKEFYLRATTREFSDYRLLTVYRSLRTKDTQSWYRPVLDELEGVCYEWVSSMRYHDDMMMGGYAVSTDYQIFRECPGHSFVHQCAVT